MSFCTKLTANLSNIDINLVKQYLAIVEDDSRDDLLNMYVQAAVSYIENTYDIALSVNTYACNYDKSYINRHLNKSSGKVEFSLIKPVNRVENVKLFNNNIKFPSKENTIIPRTELPFCTLDNKVLIDYNYLCNCSGDYIQITCTAGYFNIPNDILMAIFQLVGIMEQKGECNCSEAAISSDINKFLNPYISIL